MFAGGTSFTPANGAPVTTRSGGTAISSVDPTVRAGPDRTNRNIKVASDHPREILDAPLAQAGYPAIRTHRQGESVRSPSSLQSSSCCDGRSRRARASRVPEMRALVDEVPSAWEAAIKLTEVGHPSRPLIEMLTEAGPDGRHQTISADCSDAVNGKHSNSINERHESRGQRRFSPTAETFHPWCGVVAPLPDPATTSAQMCKLRQDTGPSTPPEHPGRHGW